MSNTPTESEFDKELDHIMGWCSGEYHSPCWYKDNVIDKGLSVEEEDDLVRTAVRRMFDKYTQAKEREARIEQSYRCRELVEANANSPEDAERYGDIVLLDVDDLLDEINGEPSESVKWKMKIDKGFGLRCKKGIHLLELQGCISCKKESKKRMKENL